MSILTRSQIAQYHRDGYLLIKNVFTPEEIAGYQDALRRHPRGESSDVYLFAVEGLQHLWHDPRMIAVAKQLHDAPITFFGQASCSRFRFEDHEHIHGRHLHQDAKGTIEHLFNRLHPAQSTSYPVVVLAIYLQDYVNFSGGLKVVPGSHLIDTSAYDESELTYVNVPSEPGDLVCFCRRVLHSPYALLLKSDPSIGLSPREEDYTYAENPDAFLPSLNDRETFFFDYARESLDADLLIKNRACFDLSGGKSIVPALNEMSLEESAREVDVGLRLDFGVVDAVVECVKSTKGTAVIPPSAHHLVTTLPKLCRLSRAWSPYYPLFATEPRDDSFETGLALLNEILPNIHAYYNTRATARRDPHMGAVQIAKLHELAKQRA